MQRADFEILKKHIKHPAKIVVVSTQCKDKINIITLEWFMRTSIKPPMFAISIGKKRYSHECLENYRYFNICFPSKEMKSFALLAGTKSGADIDKLAIANEEYFLGKYKKLPVFKNAKANIECETISQITSGDHVIYIGKVKYCWLNKEKELLLYKDL